MEAYTARAHTNIALMKYWGKADETLIIPTTTSISLTLNEFYTDTTVQFDEQLTADDVTLNGVSMSEKAAQKVTAFMDLIREQAGLTTFAHVHSINHVPTAAGLASSASAFAALAGAGSRAAGLTLSNHDLSRLARRGSGSASRSIFGGFAQWDRGQNEHDDQSAAHQLLDETHLPFLDGLQLLTVILNDQPKKIDSRGGMQHVKATSPFYQDWVDLSNKQVPEMQTAILTGDLDALGQLAEANALQMHALNTMAVPPFNYLTDASWTIINAVQTLREQGLSVYATMDAGPNVKLISKPQDTHQISEYLASLIPDIRLVAATPGPGIQIEKGTQIHDHH